LGTGKYTRKNIEWVEAGWWLPKVTVPVADENSRDRSVTINGPLGG
jgi:hypothetical protein